MTLDESARLPGEDRRGDGRSERWSSHRRRRRQELLDAAVAAIEAHGPQVGAAEIAEAAGIARPLLYRHFTGLADMHAAVLRHASRDLRGHLIPLITEDQLSFNDAVAAAAHGYLAWVAGHPNLSRYCLASTPAGLLSTLRAELASALSTRLSDIQTTGEDLAAGLVGLAEGTATWWLDHADADITALADRLSRRINAVIYSETRSALREPS